MIRGKTSKYVPAIAAYTMAASIGEERRNDIFLYRIV